MNVSAVSPLEKRSQDFNALQTTLQTGNLTAAQGAFAAFLQDVQKISTAAGPTSLFAPGSQASKDLSTLGSALRSQDLSGARAAFASLEQDLHNSGDSHAVVASRGHRPLSKVDIANNSAVPLQTLSPGNLAKSVGSVLNANA